MQSGVKCENFHKLAIFITKFINLFKQSTKFNFFLTIWTIILSEEKIKECAESRTSLSATPCFIICFSIHYSTVHRGPFLQQLHTQFALSILGDLLTLQNINTNIILSFLQAKRNFFCCCKWRGIFCFTLFCAICFHDKILM